MKLEVIMRRSMTIDIETRAVIEIPDELGYKTYDEWFDQNYDDDERTLCGIDIGAQMDVNECEVEDSGLFDEPWQFYWVREL